MEKQFVWCVLWHHIRIISHHMTSFDRLTWQDVGCLIRYVLRMPLQVLLETCLWILILPEGPKSSRKFSRFLNCFSWLFPSSFWNYLKKLWYMQLFTHLENTGTIEKHMNTSPKCKECKDKFFMSPQNFSPRLLI